MFVKTFFMQMHELVILLISIDEVDRDKEARLFRWRNTWLRVTDDKAIAESSHELHVQHLFLFLHRNTTSVLISVETYFLKHSCSSQITIYS
jgi:hypothetical protein